MVMSSWFSEALDYAQQNGPSPEEQAAEEERRRQEQLQGPVYGPPAPVYQPNAQPQEFGPSVPFDPSLVANLVTQQGAPVTYGPRNVLAEAAQGVGGGFLGGVGKAADFALSQPALNYVPGGSVIGSALDIAGVGSPTLGQAYNQDIPVVSPFMREQAQPFAGNVGALAGSVVDPTGLGSAALNRLGAPSAPEVGRFAGQGVTPVTAGDFFLNAAMAPAGAGALERLTGFPVGNPLGAIREALPPPQEAAQVYRLGVSPSALSDLPAESQLLRSLGANQVSNPAGVRILAPGEALNPGEMERYFGGRLNGPIMPGLNVTPNPEDAAVFARMADLGQNQGILNRIGNAIMPERNPVNLGAGIPPVGGYDPLRDIPPPDLGQGPQMLGGEAPAPGGRLYEPGTEPFRGAPAAARLPAEGMAGGIVDPNAFRISQTWAENMPNAPVANLSDTEVRTALYNSGLASTGPMPEVRARYETADAAGVKLPLDQPPSDMPDAFDLARRGMTPQSPLNEAPPLSPELQQRWDEINNVQTTPGEGFDMTGSRPRALEGGGSTPPLEITPHDANVSRVVPDVPANTDIAVYRGSGRDNVQSVYSGNLKEPHFQDATYYAFDQKNAATYGPNVEQGTIRLSNPLTITNDGQWRALTSDANFPYPDMNMAPAEQQRRLYDRLGEMVQARGHDGIVIRASNYGDDAQTLRRVFGHDQAIVFNKTAAETPTPRLAGGGSTPVPPSAETLAGSPPPASLTPEIGQLNPPGTGAQRASDVANSEALTQAQRDFLNSPNGQAAAAQRQTAILGNASPAAVQQQAAAIAPNVGVTPTRAQDIIKNWEFNAQITQDYVNNPQGIARLAAAVERPVEGASTGNFTDSFVTGLVQRRSDLEQALARGTNMTPDQIRQAVDGAVDQRLLNHYGTNVSGLTATKQTLAETEATARELATDFKGLNTFVERTKNTMFPLDIGFMGQNVLTGMRQGGPATLVGMANRVALALHLPFATNLEAATGLPRIIAATNDGLRFGNVASGLKPDEGTLLRYVPGLSAVDKHAVTPLIGKLTDAQYSGIGGFLKMMNYEGNLTVLGAAGKNVADPAVRREAARVTNNAWSSAATATTPGRAQAEKLLFTSPAFTRSQVAVLTDMAKILTPGASETQRILAGTAILSNVVMIAGIYKFLNDQYGVGDAQLDPTKPGFGTITLPTKNSDGRNQVINLFPQRTIQSFTTRAIDAIGDKDPDALAEAFARLGAGRAGALPSGLARAGGYGYDTQGKFYLGGMPWQERVKASIPAPVSLQNTFTGGPTDPLTMGLEFSGVPNYPESKTSEGFRLRDEAAQARTQALNDPELLTRAFPNHPEIAQAVRGSEWVALTPQEKQAILAALPPEKAAILKQADEVSAEANAEKPTAVGNRIAAQAETDKQVEGIREEYGKAFTDIGNRLESGKGDPRVLRETLTALREQMNADIQKAYAPPPPTVASVVGEGFRRIPNEAQEALALYNKIGENIPLVNGKPNFDAIQQAKDAFILDLYRTSPVTASRLDFGLKERKDAATERNVPFIQFWDDKIKPAINAYYDIPEGGRTAWRREHPMEDALLTFAGYMPSTVSPLAGEILVGLAPGRKK